MSGALAAGLAVRAQSLAAGASHGSAGTPAGDAGREAGEAWGKRLDARAARMLRPGTFDVALLNLIALDDDNVVHVLAAVGFSTIEAKLPRADTAPAGSLHECRRCAAAWWPEAWLLIAAGDGIGHVALDLHTGAWRALPLGGARGLDLIELVAHRLGLSRWKAAVALARMCGLPAVPEVSAR